MHPATWIRSSSILLLACCVCAQSNSLVGRSSPLQVVEPDANDRDLRTTPVVRAVQRSADSVVSIYLQQHASNAKGPTEGQGSGVLLDESGLAITNWHVVAQVLLGGGRAGPLDVIVKLRDGRTRSAQVLTSSANRDLALLQLRLQDGEKVKPIEIGRSADLMIGETVIAIGNPQGHANTVTSGVLSAIDRSIRVTAPDGVLREYAGLLQTDAAINQGNSGGALLDITGRLIGINNAMAMGAENIGFAIPMDTVRAEFQRELLRSSSFAAGADMPWLGLEVAEKDGAVVVSQVHAGGPAAVAGVVVGDVLAHIGELEVRSSLDYLRHMFDAKLHQDLPLRLRRDGRVVQLAMRPITRDQGLVLAAIGATVAEVDVEADPALVRKATIAFYRDRGFRQVRSFPAVLRLEQLQPDAPAESIGLQPGDILLGVFTRSRFGDGEVPITSLRDFAQLLEQQAGNSLRIAILRGNEDLIGTLDVRRAPR